MGTVYQLPVLTYPSLLPTGSSVVTSNDISDCNYGLSNALIIAQSAGSNGIGSGSDIAGTISAWYTNVSDPSRYYYVAINSSSWIHSTVSITDITSPTYRSVAWGLAANGGEIIDGSNNTLNLPFLLDAYNSRQEAVEALLGTDQVPITYRFVNVSAPTAPISARIGDTVNVSLEFPDGYGIVNPSTDVYVMSNGVLVPSTYSNGVLSFTMPNPS